jgi:multisubunit Na+/H+ antiporter MnhE subunit
VGWLGIIMLLIEITRRWQKEWQFLLLIVGAIIGAIILSGLHEIIVGSDSIIQNWWLNFFHALITDIILLFTPMAIIYGIIGVITLLIIRLVTLRRKRVSEKT